jgi:hypothetical protein
MKFEELKSGDRIRVKKSDNCGVIKTVTENGCWVEYDGSKRQFFYLKRYAELCLDPYDDGNIKDWLDNFCTQNEIPA